MRVRQVLSPAPHRAAVAAAAAATLGIILTAPANASLGRGFDSIQADRTHMAARMASQTLATHAVHTLTLPNGGVVHEYADADGTVFAVSWRGPGRPDLQQLLGASFPMLSTPVVIAGGRRVRAPITVNRSDLIVHTGGHPGAFWGLAYLPQQIPAGVTGKDLQ